MNEKKIEQPVNQENSNFIDNFIKDGQGRLGQIIGIELISGQKLLKTKFSNNVAYFPASRIGKDLELVEKENLKIPENKSTDIFLQEQDVLFEKKKLENKKLINQKTLKKYIEDYHFGLEDLRINFDESLRNELEGIIEEANKENMVFRGDGRHPYAESKLDWQEDIKGGVFKKGFEIGNGKHGDAVYLSADISRAVDYPENELMPVDWDGQKFLYFIESEIVFKKIISLDLEDVENNEILTHKIPPEYIKYAIQFDDKTGKVIKVFYNPPREN